MEHQAFLQDDGSPSPASEHHSFNGRPISNKPSSRQFFICIFTLKFCAQFVVSLLELPLLRLVERVLCDRLQNTDADEEACKIPVVQDRLALIMGYKSAFDALPCVLTALFFASISNVRGRKLVMAVASTGQLLALLWIISIGFNIFTFPIESIWISSVFLIAGGGIRVELSMLYTSFCDVVPWTERTRSLSFFHAVEGVSGLLGPAVGSLLMEYSLFAPFAVAITVFAIKYPLIWFLPETLSHAMNDRSVNGLVLQQIDSRTSQEDETLQPTSSPWDEIAKRNIASGIRSAKIWKFFQHQGLNVILVHFVAKRIGFASEQFVFQYASEILRKKLYETFWLRASNCVGMIIVLSFVVPRLTRSFSSPKRDIWVIRGSLVDIIFGFLLLWATSSFVALCIVMLICGFGEGLEVGLQSLGSYIVGEENHATFFAFVSMLGVFGELVGGPLMAWTYAIRGKDELPSGYCFLLSATLFGCLLLSTSLLNVSRLQQRALHHPPSPGSAT